MPKGQSKEIRKFKNVLEEHGKTEEKPRLKKATKYFVGGFFVVGLVMFFPLFFFFGWLGYFVLVLFGWFVFSNEIM